MQGSPASARAMQGVGVNLSALVIGLFAELLTIRFDGTAIKGGDFLRATKRTPAWAAYPGDRGTGN